MAITRLNICIYKTTTYTYIYKQTYYLYKKIKENMQKHILVACKISFNQGIEFAKWSLTYFNSDICDWQELLLFFISRLLTRN